ncbi:hypothetical protein GCM10023350_38140 [Nocardioides endophyticus]|uniref:O-antigen ligase domain-containing protein n=2 Tax=Nocardioides endophyticus TaxID=1353775 RepID=A0ABP8Z8A4_9ACTN
MPSWLRYWVIVCVLGVFGPYIVSGARTEQLVIYGSAAAVVVTQLPRLFQILRPALLVLGLWAAYAVVVVGGGLIIDNHMPWPSGSLVAGVDNALLPLASIVVFTFWTSLAGSESVLRLVSWVVAWAMGANAVLAIVTTYLGLDAVPGIGRFWGAGGFDSSVAVLAEQMGRFSGVFNQPAEAGVAYSLAALGILFLARVEPQAPRPVLWVLLALVVIGGLLTLSKVFVVGGLVLALITAITDRRNRRQSVPVGILAVGVAAGLGMANLAGSWGASIMLNWYRVSIQAGDSFPYTLSAGRFGTPGDNGAAPSITPSAPVDTGGSGTDGAGGPTTEPEVPLPTGLSDVAHQILDNQPVFGVGARGLQVAYDSTWTEAMIVGGVVGLVLMLLVYVVLVARWVSNRRIVPRSTSLFAGAVVLLTVGASFGMPALTGNRESTLLWMFLVPLVVAYRPAPGAPEPAAGYVAAGHGRWSEQPGA